MTKNNLYLSFNQKSLLNEIKVDQHIKCEEIRSKYGGLCDIACNCIALHKLLKNEKDLSKLDYYFNEYFVLNNIEKRFCDSHIMKITSAIEKYLHCYLEYIHIASYHISNNLIYCAVLVLSW